MSWPSLTCVERPWPRLSCAMTRYPLFRKYRSWLSQSSLLRGQPWWKTTGWASRGPQSLYVIVTPSLVVMVFMRIPPVGAGVLFGEGASFTSHARAYGDSLQLAPDVRTSTFGDPNQRTRWSGRPGAEPIRGVARASPLYR